MEQEYKRGDVIVSVAAGDYGKPRPMVVVQSDLFNHTHQSLTVCPITSHSVQAPLFRIPMRPTKGNGLKKASQLMIDKVNSVKREKISRKIGTVSDAMLDKIEEALKLWLDLA